MVILAMNLQVLSELLYALAEESYLHIRGTRVARVNAVGGDDFLASFLSEHRPPIRWLGRPFLLFLRGEYSTAL